MSETLPNAPLAIIITEAGSENLVFRALLKKAVITLVCGSQEMRSELSGLIASALDDVTPETCPVCEGIIFEECRCGEDYTDQQYKAMRAARNR